jgi:hypothetical protein
MSPLILDHERLDLMMPLVRRSLAAFASTAVVTLLLTGGDPLGAQESKTTKSQTSKAKQAGKTDAPPADEPAAKGKGTGRVAPPDPTHRVPPGYAKLGLTDQQRESLYKIQAKYYPQIQELEKQVDAVRARREKEFEGVLTAAQKRRLAEQEQQRKAESAARKAVAEKSAEKSGG